MTDRLRDWQYGRVTWVVDWVTSKEKIFWPRWDSNPRPPDLDLPLLYRPGFGRLCSKKKHIMLLAVLIFFRNYAKIMLSVTEIMLLRLRKIKIISSLTLSILTLMNIYIVHLPVLQHSRPQSPSFLGHVVRKPGALEAAVTGCEKISDIRSRMCKSYKYHCSCS